MGHRAGSQPRAGQRPRPAPLTLTYVEGVGCGPVAELQVEEVGGLRVMAEPQGHTQDHASGQLGKERMEVTCGCWEGWVPRTPPLGLWLEGHRLQATCTATPTSETPAASGRRLLRCPGFWYGAPSCQRGRRFAGRMLGNRTSGTTGTPPAGAPDTDTPTGTAGYLQPGPNRVSWVSTC